MRRTDRLVLGFGLFIRASEERRRLLALLNDQRRCPVVAKVVPVTPN